MREWLRERIWINPRGYDLRTPRWLWACIGRDWSMDRGTWRLFVCIKPRADTPEGETINGWRVYDFRLGPPVWRLYRLRNGWTVPTGLGWLAPFHVRKHHR